MLACRGLGVDAAGTAESSGHFDCAPQLTVADSDLSWSCVTVRAAASRHAVAQRVLPALHGGGRFAQVQGRTFHIQFGEGTGCRPYPRAAARGQD